MIGHIQLVGCLLMALSLIHVFFPRYFKWKDDLKPLSLINRQMMYIHTFFLAFALLLLGLLCVFAADELTDTPLGKKLSYGFALFWTARLMVQFIGYHPSLWKGKKKETIIHILFVILWIYISAVFWMNAYY
ncbi:hypothetical protein H8S90_13725 [Olivibacter sp. SDN3]|uniref:hypothetical protein n=1 Tax=Olivibacter sp. SDN3 TaxID=2764720 RepID=UPI0016516C17|nr:hypothetical protein [Olivibacter sp. SDN3]QNL47878.1 hypothetical protein H8S90_13725 [Olivibacter sp. SDN3]